MNKIDKQIEKILNTYCWADGGCLSKYKSDDKVVSQIKQSILKAIEQLDSVAEDGWYIDIRDIRKLLQTKTT